MLPIFPLQTEKQHRTYPEKMYLYLMDLALLPDNTSGCDRDSDVSGYIDVSG